MGDVYVLKESEVRLKLAEGRSLYSTVPLDNPDIAVQTMGGLLKELDHEIACVVNLDNKLRPINFTIIGVGGPASCQVSVSSIFKSALLSGASSILLMHNHPSGDVSPSTDDLNLTRRLVQAGSLIEMPLDDHIIIGGVTGDWYSIRFHHPEIDFHDAPSILSEQIRSNETKKRRGRR